MARGLHHRFPFQRKQPNPGRSDELGQGTMRCVVLEKLDFLVRFWELNARHATVGQPLSPAEQIELLSLLQLVTSDLQVPNAGPLARSHPGLPGQMIGDGSMRAIDIRAVTAAALLVTTADACAVGSHVIVHAADAVAGVEIAIPCRVRWVHEGSPASMALVVDGVPTKTTFETFTGKQPQVQARLFARTERMLG